MNIAISIAFVNQMNSLPQQVRGAVTDFFSKFSANPESGGINYEIVKGSYKNSLHSVRINQDYRAIIGRPSKDVYLMLWVDKHDDAYKWAIGRCCEVNAKTGAVQVFMVEEVEKKIETPVFVPKPPGLFDAFKDKELLRIGLPPELLPKIRQLITDQDFESLMGSLPEELSEPLYLMASGYSFQDVLAQLEYKDKPDPIDTSDVLAALRRHESQRQFKVLDSEKELSEILGASLEQWRIFLHPSQRKLVERDWNGPVRVLGGAGTGKTVAAMHRVKWLLEQRLKSRDQRILFTTFSKNLAADIRQNLDRLLSAKKDQVEVLHLGAWVSRFLKTRMPDWRIFYEGADSEDWKQALSEKDSSLGLEAPFYRDEWEQVVLAQGIDNGADYLRARRVGRGTSLTGSQRQLVWKVFETYRSLLSKKHLFEPDDAMRQAIRIMASEGGHGTYAAIIVDESQDLGFQAFKLLRQMAGEQHVNDLFIVGDPHQRIYGKTAALSASGIDIRGRGRKLRVNYRTTEEIKKQAVAVLYGQEMDDLDNGKDDLAGYHSLVHGPKPLFLSSDDFNGEIEAIIEYLKKIPHEGCCIVARSNEYLDQISAQLKANNLTTCIIEPNKEWTNRNSGIRLATMHRVKGLEFDTVIVAGLCAACFPLPPPAGLDKTAQACWMMRERSLLYVAMTRARKEVVLSAWGKMNSSLEEWLRIKKP
jgi:Superfamily I DNA and RNA helicases